jgi:hypothetical protein
VGTVSYDFEPEDSSLSRVAVEVLYGPIYHRLLLHTRPLTPDQVTSVLELAFTGLRPVP